MLKQLREQLDSGQTTATKLTTEYLTQIKEKNPALNAYVLVTEELALQQATAADKLIQAGKQSLFTGIPYAAKDIYCVKDIETTACSNILRGYKPPYTATVINRLTGAVLLGKTNADEFAMGSSTENSCFGVTKNPADITRVAGGSSGGSAAAVAASLAPFAFGSDTGGSIRQPASFCGVVGMRPTYGLVPRYGVIPMASSFDTVGPLTESVEDLAMIMETIAGPDQHDSNVPENLVVNYTENLEQPISQLKIGLAKQYLEIDGLNPAVKKIVHDLVNQLSKQGAEVIEVDMPHTSYAMPSYYILVPSEVSSNLARFDGIRYGFRSNNTTDLLSVYMNSRGEGFGAEAKRRIMLGTYALSSGYYDAYYLKAMKVRSLVRQDFTEAFKKVDVLMTPPCPGTAFVIGANSQDPLQMYLEDVYTIPPSLAGVPALVVPAGSVDNLPVGVQIIGPQWSESKLLRVGRMVEQVIY
ncbi:MAG: Asp-tRNA(Asn)/Glu-tRNA(Gln) amidotransferase subunit GatA [Patescibacteria group bacterium]|jgi:aspartyl-tRNA(Asn)/glutamyl-tRNA(Gln) amidotransferase subunit A